MNNLLKFDPNNTTILAQKQTLLKESVDNTKTKLQQLKDVQGQVEAQFKSGDIGAEQYRAFQRELEKTQSQLKNTQKDLTDVEKTSGNVGEKISANFKSAGSNIKSALSTDAIKSAIGGIGVAVGGFLTSSLSEAKEAETANADLAQSLKSTNGAAGMTMKSLDALASSLSKSTTFSDDQVKAGESMLLTFTNIGKGVFPQATSAVLDFAQKMGTDPKQAALQLGKALNDPANGLSKLTKSGVTFTDAQKNQITAMQKAGDVAGAQKLMIAELNKEFGGQATAAASTYKGKQKQLGNTMKELQETIGTALIPALTKILQFATPIIQSIGEFVEKHPQLTTAILAIVAVVGTLIGGLSILTTIMTALGVTEIAALGPVALIIAAIMGVIAVVVLIATHINALEGIAHAALQGVSGAFQTAKEAVVSVWNSIPGFFAGIWGAITGTFSSIGGWFGARFDEARTGIENAFSSIGSFFSGVWDTISGLFSQVGTTVGNAVSDAFKSVVNAVIKFAENDIDGFISSINNAIGIINDIPGVHISMIPELHLPRLAEGGIVSKPTLALIGEAGQEAVMPLKNNREWISGLAQQLNQVQVNNTGIPNTPAGTTLSSFKPVFYTTLHIDGNADTATVQRLEGLKDDIAQQIADKATQGFNDGWANLIRQSKLYASIKVPRR